MTHLEDSDPITRHLEALEGRDIERVIFEQGATILDFGVARVACYVPPRVFRDRWFSSGDGTWANHIVGLLETEVVGIAVEGNVAVLSLMETHLERDGYGEVVAKLEFHISSGGHSEVGVLDLDVGKFLVLR